MAISEHDKLLIYNDIIRRLTDDGLYITSAQANAKWVGPVRVQVPISASPMQTSGAYSPLELIVRDFVNGITEYYSVSAIGVSGLGLTLLDPICAYGDFVGLKYNIDNLKIDPNGQLNTIQDVNSNSDFHVKNIYVSDLTNGQIVIVSGGRLITSAIDTSVTVSYNDDHSALINLANDDHDQYIISNPLTDTRNVISAGSDRKSLTLIGSLTQTKNLFDILDSSRGQLFSVSANGSVTMFGSAIISGASKGLIFSNNSSHSISTPGSLVLSAQNLTFTANSISAIHELVIEPGLVRVVYLSGSGDRIVYANQFGNLNEFNLIRWSGNNIIIPSLSGIGDRYVIVSTDGTLRYTSATTGSGSLSGSGSGTINTITKFITSSSIGDSLISENGSLIFVNGNLKIGTLTGILSGANGQVVVAPTLPINVGGTNNTSYTGARFIWFNGSSLVSSPFTSASFSISANGTPGFLSKFSTPNSFSDSTISDNGSIVVIRNSLSATGNVNILSLSGTDMRLVTVSSLGQLASITLSNFVSGSGTTGKIPIWNSNNGLGDSIIFGNSSLISIGGNLSANNNVQINGALNVSGTSIFSGFAKFSGNTIIDNGGKLTVIGGISATGNVNILSLSGSNTRNLGIDSNGLLTITGNVSADISGTPGRISKFITPISIGDSKIIESGNNISVSANLESAVSFYMTSGNGGYWFGSIGSNNYGMRWNGTNLGFRSGSVVDFMNVDNSGIPTFANSTIFLSTVDIGLALRFTDFGSAGNGKVWRSNIDGLSLRSVSGSSYDFALYSTSANYLIRNPKGTQGLEFPGSGLYSFNGGGLLLATSGLSVSGSVVVKTLAGTSTRLVSVDSNGLLSSTLSLSNFISGAGTTGKIPIWLGTNSIGDSIIFGNSSLISIPGALSATGALSVQSGLVHSNTTMVNGSSTNRGLLIIGADSGVLAPVGAATGQEIQIDVERIQAMNGATPSMLSINPFGGTILVGGSINISGVSTHGNQSLFRNGTSIDGVTTDKGFIVIGASSSQQIQIDADDIQSMNGSSRSNLYLNYTGGHVIFSGLAASTGAVGIGEDTTPVGMLDVRSKNSGVIASFGARSTVSSVYPGYIYFSEVNTINSGYLANTNAELWLNYNGYLNGITQFRDLSVGDGKQTRWAFFKGASKRLIINNASTDDGIGTLQVNGKISGFNFYNNYIYNDAVFHAEASGGAYFQANDGTTAQVRFAPAGNAKPYNMMLRQTILGADLTPIAGSILVLGGSTATLTFGSSSSETGPYEISVLGSGSATPSTKGTANGRNLIITAGASDNTASKVGGDLYLRPGAPTFPATTYGDIYVADLGGNLIFSRSTPSAYFLHYSCNGTQFLLNSTGSNFGTIQNDSANTWSLGYKTTQSSSLGTPALTWNSSGDIFVAAGGGNVRIGDTTTPSYKLDVNGSCKIRQALIVDSYIFCYGSIDAVTGVTAGYLGLNGGINTTTRFVNSNTTLDSTYLFVSFTGACTITLPSAGDSHVFWISRQESFVGVASITTVGGDSIIFNGSSFASLSLVTGSSILIVSNTNKWTVMNWHA